MGAKSEYLRGELAPSGLNFKHTVLMETQQDIMHRMSHASLTPLGAVRPDSSLTHHIISNIHIECYCESQKLGRQTQSFEDLMSNFHLF